MMISRVLKRQGTLIIMNLLSKSTNKLSTWLTMIKFVQRAQVSGHVAFYSHSFMYKLLKNMCILPSKIKKRVVLGMQWVIGRIGDRNELWRYNHITRYIFDEFSITFCIHIQGNDL